MKKTETKLRLPASSAHVWAHCGGSAGIRSARSPFESRDEARRGVVVHKIGANMLRTADEAELLEKLDPIEYQIYEAEKEDIDTAAAFYAGHVLADFKAIRATDKGATLHVEERLTVEGKTFTIDGPPDAFIVSPAANAVTVYDLKSGWVEVEAENNAQLLVYAHSIAAKYLKPDQTAALRGVIIQPPLAQVASAEYKFDAEFFDRLTVDPARFTVGQHCGGCAVKTACKAFSVAVKKYLAPEYKDATADRLKVWPALLEIAKPAEKFFAEIQSQAFAYLSAGGTIPGWGLKAVAGRRTWSKEATADALAKAFRVKADVFEKRSLESVAAVEKVLKTAGVDSEKLASFYYQPSTPRLTKTEHEEKFLTAKQSKAKPVKGKKKIEKVQKVKRKK